MSYYNVWMAFSSIAIAEFKARRSDTDYSGPMDDTTFKVMSKMADLDVVQSLYKETDPIGGKQYKLFSMYIRGTTGVAARDAIDHITAEWPAHIITIGAWLPDGRQAGTLWNEDRTDVTGTPAYPVHAQAWRIMPDVVTYDEQGDELTRTPATSNTDLRDINLLAGQQPRMFN